MNLVKMYRKRRAVSPILAAILLIGLAVAAGAVLFVVVLPLIGGTADVEFVSAVADDRNNDGLLDQITVQVQNSGAEVDSFAEGTISLTGWSAAANIEIGLANPVDLVFKTTDVTQQVEETQTLSITLKFDTSADITLAETDVDMDHATTLTDSDMLIDFTDGFWYAEKTSAGAATGSDTVYSTDTTRSTHSGKAGAQMDHNGANAGQDDVIYFRCNADTTDQWQDNQNTKALSPEEWDVAATPVLSFWLKTDGGTAPAAGGTDPDLYLVLAMYDGETLEQETQNILGDEIEDFAVALQSSDSGWVHVVVDLSQYSGTWAATMVGSFGIRVIADANLNVAIDDVSVHTGLS
jgi:hypothetical protein